MVWQVWAKFSNQFGILFASGYIISENEGKRVVVVTVRKAQQMERVAETGWCGVFLQTHLE